MDSQKYLSIITNFGCHYTCPYCIVRENGLRIPKTTDDGLNKLKQTIIENECNIVSLSGGGDPIYNFEKNLNWYVRLHNIMDSLNMKLELHTSYTSIPFEIQYKKRLYARIVYHLRTIQELRDVKPIEGVKTRVVYVVTKQMKRSIILYIALFCKIHGYELSFRQMVDNHYRTTYFLYDFLKRGHKKLWWYIEQNDYNLYYCENKTYTEYRSIGDPKILLKNKNGKMIRLGYKK